jgi:hypothetical protein
MQALEFYTLPRPVQDRFIESCKGTGVPAPLAVRFPVRRGPLVWLAAALLLLLVSAALVRWGYGDLESTRAIASKTSLFVYAALVGLAATAALASVLVKRAPGLSPFRPGLFLYPVGVVDARGPSLRVFAIDTAKSVAIDGDALAIAFEQATFRFRNKKARLEEHLAVLRDAQARLPALRSENNRRELAALDPLCDTGFSSPFSPTTPLLPPNQRVAWTIGIPVCLALGGLAGWQVWLARNAKSDELIFSEAVRRGKPDAFAAYLARGGVRSEVRDVLMPRAKLKVAREQHSVGAIEALAGRPEFAGIEDEVTSALRDALLTELAQVAAKDSVTALRGFGREQAHAGLVKAELALAIDGKYRAALDRYRTQSGSEDGALSDFVAELLDHAKQHGPAVRVVVRRAIRASLSDTDKQLKKDKYFLGPAALPRQYFEPPHATAREDAVAKELVALWQAPFPKDILTVEPASAEEAAPDAPLPDVTVPTLFVTYTVGGAGIYRSRSPRGVFVGIGVVFDTAFVVPGRKKKLQHKSSTWRRPEPASVPAGSELTIVPAVYADMADDGFRRFLKQYRARYFKGVGSKPN